MAKLFVCKICGEPYIGGEEPDDCPFCGAPKNYIKSIEEYTELWVSEISDPEKEFIKETKELEVNAAAYYKKVSDSQKKYSKYNRLFKQLTRVEKEHAEVACKFLGIDLPELVGEDSKEDLIKDLERTKELESDAVEKYTNFLKKSTNLNVKNFFNALLHAEKGHHSMMEEELK